PGWIRTGCTATDQIAWAKAVVLRVPEHLKREEETGGTRMSNVQSLIHADLRHALREAVLEDRTVGSFKVNRRVFVDDAVLALERQAIFDHCWLYIGHASEVPRPGSFVTRKISGRPLLFNRDRQGKLRAFYNTCSHRGAVICREHTGTRRAFQCPYHGWVYDDLGTLVDVPGRESM